MPSANIKVYLATGFTDRKFTAVIKAGGNKKKPSGYAGTALKYISKLYKIEKQSRENELSPEALKQERQDKALLALLEFKKWLDSRIEKVPPKSLLGKAILYAINQWHRLIQYVCWRWSRIPIDNNVSENAIRPFVVGRKNWLFSCTP